MRGVRAAGDWINQHFRVAVIGGDEHCTAFALYGRFNLREATIEGFDGFDGGLDLAGVPDHVGVREIDDNHIEAALVDCFDYRVRDSLSAHFRL